MKFKEVVSRLTGISTPVFGAQWRPPETEIEVAKRVLAFLEDRRILFDPPHMEFEPFCIQSALEIRKFLTKELGSLNRKRPLAQSLSAMRAACRRFLDALPPQGSRGSVWVPWDPRGGWQLLTALGELRAIMGVHVAQVAAQHGLSVEAPLASILPSVEPKRRKA